VKTRVVTDPAEVRALVGVGEDDEEADPLDAKEVAPVEECTSFHSPTILVTRQYPKSKVEESRETLEVLAFVTEPAKVTVELGVTLNLGDYESARVTVGVSAPCYREEVMDAYQHWLQFAKTRLVEEQAEIKQWAVTRGAKNSDPF